MHHFCLPLFSKNPIETLPGKHVPANRRPEAPPEYIFRAAARVGRNHHCVGCVKPNGYRNRPLITSPPHHFGLPELPWQVNHQNSGETKERNLTNRRATPRANAALPSQIWLACSRNPSARVTFKIVAKLGLPSPDKAL
jgi:hypothetical protein